MDHFFLFLFSHGCLSLSLSKCDERARRYGTVHGIDGVVHVVAEHKQLYMIPGMDGVVHVVGDHHVYGPRTTCTVYIVHCTWSMPQIHSLFVAHRLLSTSPAC